MFRQTDYFRLRTNDTFNRINLLLKIKILPTSIIVESHCTFCAMIVNSNNSVTIVVYIVCPSQWCPLSVHPQAYHS